MVDEATTDAPDEARDVQTENEVAAGHVHDEVASDIQVENARAAGQVIDKAANVGHDEKAQHY